MTISTDHFVSVMRENVNNDKLTAAQFRDFVRTTLENVNGYTTYYEFSVLGTHTHYANFTGQLDSIKSQIRDATNIFVKELMDSDEKNGDLSGYVPANADGYPSLGGFAPEQGETFGVTFMGLWRNDTHEELSYHHSLCVELRDSVGG